jgi:hypothetical protein
MNWLRLDYWFMIRLDYWFMMKIRFFLDSIILCSLYHEVYSLTPAGIHIEKSGQAVTEVDIRKLPKTGEGVRILPESEVFHPPLTRSAQLAFDNEKKLGYVKRKSIDAINLLKMNKGKFLIKGEDKYYYSSEPYDTHLKKSLSQITLAFDYQPLSFISPKDTLGFAVAMTWKNGWTGISQFFKYQDIGACKYLKTSVSLNGSSVQLSKERINYYINEKPAVSLVEGQESEGFSYSVEWYDNNYFHTLICATNSFSPQIKDRMRDLALLIDKD